MSERESNIVLTGFMGTGKSTVGQIVAERMGRPFVDTDTVIAERAGKPIARIFEEDGEDAFRALEAQACQDAAGNPGRVIATGGGAFTNPAAAQAFAESGVIICLTADLEVIMERVDDPTTRPLFTDHEALVQLLADRARLYASLPHHIDTTDRTPEQVAETVIRTYKIAQKPHSAPR